MCSNYFSTCQNRDYKRYDKAVKLFKNNEFDKSKTILLKIIDKNPFQFFQFPYNHRDFQYHRYLTKILQMNKNLFLLNIYLTKA